jgi:pimeloyl-ACP methyl ester carboxylesterase
LDIAISFRASIPLGFFAADTPIIFHLPGWRGITALATEGTGYSTINRQWRWNSIYKETAVKKEQLLCGNRVSFTVSPASVSSFAADHPLIVAIHGGTYSGKYFDIKGHSLLDRAAAIGISAAAVDRPHYGSSVGVASRNGSIESSALAVNEAISELWSERAGCSKGVFIVGHSIGGAISILLAAMDRNWPLLGIAISGIGLRSPDSVVEQWRGLPPLESIEVPAEAKDFLMYGPEGSYLQSVRALAHEADSQTPRQELIDIVFEWPRLLREAAPRVEVPIHYRQPEFDNLWIVDQTEVAAFKAQFTRSSLVDGKLMRGVGHNIDFHRLGAAFQLEQLSFALACST